MMKKEKEKEKEEVQDLFCGCRIYPRPHYPRRTLCPYHEGWNAALLKAAMGSLDADIEYLYSLEVHSYE